MGAPLLDITIYYRGQVIKDDPNGLGFSRTINYIADFYHHKLNGYKPPKTGRICIHLGPIKNWNKPNYFGSICSYDNIIDEQKYLGLSNKKKYKYILDILHSTVSEIASLYDWDQTIFDKAYNHIIESDFKFEKLYPEKKSKDRKHTGLVILTKTEENSMLSAVIKAGTSEKKVLLIVKSNHYWYDNIYLFAKNSKWLDNSSFGFFNDQKSCYYSTEDNRVVSDFIFGED